MLCVVSVYFRYLQCSYLSCKNKNFETLRLLCAWTIKHNVFLDITAA